NSAPGGGIIPPGALVVPAQPLLTVIDMAGGEYGNIAANIRQGLELGGHAQPPVAVVSPIKRTNPDRIAGNEIARTVRVAQRQCKCAFEPGHKPGAVAPAQRAQQRLFAAVL